MLTLGLIINSLGAILLAIGTSAQTSILSKIINSIADAYGTWSATKIPENKIQSFRKTKRISMILNILGYVFFVIGFSIQIIANQKNVNP